MITGRKSGAFIWISSAFVCFVFVTVEASYYLLRGEYTDSRVLLLVVLLAAGSWLLWRLSDGFVVWLALMLAQARTVFLLIPKT